MGDQEADKKDKQEQKPKSEEKFKPGAIALNSDPEDEMSDGTNKPDKKVAPKEDDDTDEGEGFVEDPDDDSEGDGQEEETEDQIVLEGETPPQQVPLPSFLKRVGKLTGQVQQAKGETVELQKENEFLKEENRIYKLAHDQKQSAPKPVEIPNPDDFDEGVGDPGYVTKINEYNQSKITEGIQQGIAEVNKSHSVSTVANKSLDQLKKKVHDHYDNAAKLKVKDYEETEDKAIAIFGEDHFKSLISFLPGRSHIAAYYFGKNPTKAQKFQDMFEADPGRALIEIGGLLEKVKVKSVKSNDLPDPDEEVDGGKLPSKKKRGPVGAKYE